MTLWIDADACPVKEEAVAIARSFEIPVVMVANINHHLPQWEGVRICHVDFSSQAADLFIANGVKAGDCLLTGDFGLAALALAKGVHTLSFRGMVYLPEKMDELLAQRHHSARMRRGGKKVKGPSPFTREDRLRFCQELNELFDRIKEGIPSTHGESD